MQKQVNANRSKYAVRYLEFMSETVTQPDFGFSNWFGRSVVVRDGQPLEVYHGSAASHPIPFKMRSKSINSTTLGDVATTRRGAFFTANPAFAAQYGTRVGGYFLSLQHPAEITRDRMLDFADSLDAFTERDLWVLAKYQTKPWIFFDGELGERFVHYLIAAGFDGATFHEDVESPAGESIEGTTFVAFHPQQIRHVSK